MGQRGTGMAELVLSDSEPATLERWARRHTSAQALALRCEIVLACAEGGSNAEVAQRLGVSRMTVGKWRARFVVHRLDGLHDEPCPGGPRSIGDDDVERVVVKTLEETPADATHWSTVDGRGDGHVPDLRSRRSAVGQLTTNVCPVWSFGSLQRGQAVGDARRRRPVAGRVRRQSHRRRHDTDPVIIVAGELDASGTQRFGACLRAVLDKHPRSLAVDTRGLTFLDSSGLRSLLLARAAAFESPSVVYGPGLIG